MALTVLLALAACSGGRHEAGDDAKARLADEWGLEIQSVRLTAGDYLLDFRYRVLDPAKASRAVNPKASPYLIDEASGERFIVPAPPKIGPLRNTGRQLEAQRSYFALFANPGRRIKRGDRVTVAMGDFRARHLVVE